MLVDLRADGVAVRTPRLSDLDVLVETDSVGSLPTSTNEREERRARLTSRIEADPDLLADGLAFFTIEHTAIPVGDIQVRAPRYGFPPGVCELGLSLVATARGRGIGRVALRLLTDALLEDGWSRVQGSTELSNLAMCRAFEHAGFVSEGVARSYLPDERGDRIDAMVYARVRSGR